jgi:hypothetical protein
MPRSAPRESACFYSSSFLSRETDQMPGIFLQWNSVKRLGATVVLVGEAYDETQAYAKQRALEEGRVFVPPFDHPDVIAGQVRAQCRLRFLEFFGGQKHCPGLFCQGPTILTSSQATSCLTMSSLPGSPFVSFLRPPVELSGGAQKDYRLQAAKQRVLLKEAYSREELQTVSSAFRNVCAHLTSCSKVLQPPQSASWYAEITSCSCLKT